MGGWRIGLYHNVQRRSHFTMLSISRYAEWHVVAFPRSGHIVLGLCPCRCNYSNCIHTCSTLPGYMCNYLHISVCPYFASEHYVDQTLPLHVYAMYHTLKYGQQLDCTQCVGVIDCT